MCKGAAPSLQHCVCDCVQVTGGTGSTDGLSPSLPQSAWPFAIDNRTGQLSFNRVLVYPSTAAPVVVSGYATRAYYQLTMQITDRGNLSATAQVPVAILANITAGVLGVITSFNVPVQGALLRSSCSNIMCLLGRPRRQVLTPLEVTMYQSVAISSPCLVSLPITLLAALLRSTRWFAV